MDSQAEERVEKFAVVVDLSLKIINGTEVHVSVPKELRLTRPFMVYLSEALQKRGLQLKHLDIKNEHRQDLRELPDATIEEDQDNFRIQF